MWLSNWTTASVQIFQCIPPPAPSQQSLCFFLSYTSWISASCPVLTPLVSILRDWFLCNPNSSTFYCHLFTLVFPEITFAQVFFLLKHAKQWLYFDGWIASGFRLLLVLFCIFWAFTVHMYYLVQQKKQYKRTTFSSKHRLHWACTTKAKYKNVSLCCQICAF